MSLVGVALSAAHILLGSLWLGAMAYSIGVVQPRARRFFAVDPARYEEFATYVASGARWRVVGLIIALALTGVGLVLLQGARQPASWWLVVGAKAVLLLVCGWLFWQVSWRMWPRRLFALPEEAPGHQRAFLRAGWTLLLLVTASAVLGAAASRFSD